VKILLPILAGVTGLVLASLVQAPDLRAQSAKVESLRGPVQLQDTSPPPELGKPAADASVARAYRQQPPLIPHEIEGYDVDLKANQCLGCHDWPNNASVGAPKVSETHYLDRNGVALDQVSRARWFCNQCHVPQADARPLVENTFKSAAEVE
jgi:cytochrome c-type protein NapB